MANLFQFPAARMFREEFDHSLIFGILIAGLGPGVEFPARRHGTG